MEYSMVEIGATPIWTLGIIVLHIITVTTELIIYLISHKGPFKYSRVPNITVGLNKSVGGNFSWKLIKK